MTPRLAALAVFLLGAGCAPAAREGDAPSLILHDADVFTGDSARPRARALAVRGEHIVAVGSDAEVLALAGPATRLVDLDGRLVVPGLNDAHIHVGPWPPMRELGLSGAADPAWRVVRDSVRAAAAALPPGSWISGEIGGAVLETPAATRFALDSVSPEHPVMLSGFTGHGLLLNTAALRALAIPLDAPDRPGGWFGRVADTPTLDGRVWEYAHLAVIRQLSAPPSRSDAIGAYRALADRMLRWGVTSVQQMENDRAIQETLAALAEADLPIRWTLFEWPMPVDSVGEPRPP
ncbi:MAG TPA: amidohydrolase family protein, partial [Gemmatimonadaceae bacterium]